LAGLVERRPIAAIDQPYVNASSALADAMVSCGTSEGDSLRG
jgi:hypothetical protein